MSNSSEKKGCEFGHNLLDSKGSTTSVISATSRHNPTAVKNFKLAQHGKQFCSNQACTKQNFTTTATCSEHHTCFKIVYLHHWVLPEETSSVQVTIFLSTICMQAFGMSSTINKITRSIFFFFYSLNTCKYLKTQKPLQCVHQPQLTNETSSFLKPTALLRIKKLCEQRCDTG